MGVISLGREAAYSRAMKPTSPKPSARKLVAIALILLLILFWAVLIASLSVWLGALPILVQALFYLIVGIAWIAPLKPLIRWSQSGPERGQRTGRD